MFAILSSSVSSCRVREHRDRPETGSRKPSAVVNDERNPATNVAHTPDRTVPLRHHGLTIKTLPTSAACWDPWQIVVVPSTRQCAADSTRPRTGSPGPSSIHRSEGWGGLWGGFGWLVWCPAVGWVLGRVDAGFGGCWRVVDAGLVGVRQVPASGATEGSRRSLGAVTRSIPRSRSPSI